MLQVDIYTVHILWYGVLQYSEYSGSSFHEHILLLVLGVLRSTPYSGLNIYCEYNVLWCSQLYFYYAYTIKL
jgi:hypothetical protein